MELIGEFFEVMEGRLNETATETKTNAPPNQRVIEMRKIAEYVV
jgi:hypothetical protein